MQAPRILQLAATLLFIGELCAQPVVIGSFPFGGVQREYRLYVPASYSPGTPAPLILNLHGLGSNMQQQELYGDFRAIADTAGFILVHPNGTLDPTGTRFWNVIGLSTVDDLGFLVALIDTVSAQYNIDPERVYSTGMSNGGYMSYELACFRSERITAIASVTGALIIPRFNACSATHPTPVMQIHGTEDPTVPYGGSTTSVGIDALVNYWASFNNCSPSPSITQVPDIDPNDGCTVEHRVYSGGDGGSSVELHKVLGGGHTWPGAIFPIGVTNQDINASKEIWRFFSQYRLGQLVGVAEHGEIPTFTAGPNPSSGEVTVRFDKAEWRTLRVLDALGRCHFEWSGSATEVPLFLPSSGVHILHVSDRHGSSAQRLVRE